MDGLRGLHGWQWIFIIEAIPTLLFGILTYFVLPDYPAKTSCKYINLNFFDLLEGYIREESK